MYPRKADVSIPMPSVTVIPQPNAGITVLNPCAGHAIDPTTGWPVELIKTGKVACNSLMPNVVQPLNGGILTAPEVTQSGNQKK